MPARLAPQAQAHDTRIKTADSMAERIKYPAPGCVVEFIENNSVQIAVVLEEAGGKLRLLLPSRRETRLAANRLLPWPGPQHKADLGREEYVRIMEEHRRARQCKADQIDIMAVWELAQGEVSLAPATWFAELCENDPDYDSIAAYGGALLACKTHFRFQAPDFLVYDAETVGKRLDDQRAREEREALVEGGAAFLRTLWEHAAKNSILPPDSPALAGQPDEKILHRIQTILFARLLNPDTRDDEALWLLLSKGLPDVPHLPLQLLTAWGKLPPHYNFWLDRAGYESGDDWWHGFELPVGMLYRQGQGETVTKSPFISIDSAKTRDIDDAFFLEKNSSGWLLTVALACPAATWPFGSSFDKRVLHRATSIYLPEGDLHMLPENLGANALSLFAGRQRPVFCLRLDIDKQGNITNCQPGMDTMALAENLTYEDCQAVLDAMTDSIRLPDNPAAKHGEMLADALDLAKTMRDRRIERGAIVMERPDVDIRLDKVDGKLRVAIGEMPKAGDAQLIVSEMMIAASSAIADWAFEHGIPLVHRTQNVAVPKEYAGIWSDPVDLARIMRYLAPSILESTPRLHAALAAQRYAPVTSPLRRYADLLNEGQIIHFLRTGSPRWRLNEMDAILDRLIPALESATQVQKFRPRYWKLLYFRQQGDQAWWDGVITEENDAFVTVSLPAQGMFVRGKRHLFDERAAAGLAVSVRIGKVNPLYNEIQILEAMTNE